MSRSARRDCESSLTNGNTVSQGDTIIRMINSEASIAKNKKAQDLRTLSWSKHSNFRVIRSRTIFNSLLDQSETIHTWPDSDALSSKEVTVTELAFKLAGWPGGPIQKQSFHPFKVDTDDRRQMHTEKDDAAPSSRTGARLLDLNDRIDTQYWVLGFGDTAQHWHDIGHFKQSAGVQAMVAFTLHVRDLSSFRLSSTSSLEGKIADAWVIDDSVVALVNRSQALTRTSSWQTSESKPNFQMLNGKFPNIMEKHIPASV
ncbi:hypothetical protein EDD22DRAFT_853400 [Suillus occidentalis]|nr:hypothetical protein EDD22DRAFT_853400 [Suillus occidentalis]